MDMYNLYCNGGGPDSAYKAYIVCASTGKADDAVGARTVHAAFKFTRHHDGGLSDSDLHVNIEVSMLAADAFYRIECRLCQLTYNYDQPFGDLDIITSGDL